MAKKELTKEDCENYVICFVSGQIEVYDWIDLITNNKEIREEYNTWQTRQI